MKKLCELKMISDDTDVQNYEFAKMIFVKEEGREPNMNDAKDANMVAALEVGVRYTRNSLQLESR